MRECFKEIKDLVALTADNSAETAENLQYKCRNIGSMFENKRIDRED